MRDVRDAVSIAKAEGGRKGRIERDENEHAATIPVTFTKPCVHCFHQTGVDGSVTRPVCHRCQDIEQQVNGPRPVNPIKVHPPPPPMAKPESETRVWKKKRTPKRAARWAWRPWTEAEDQALLDAPTTGTSGRLPRGVLPALAKRLGRSKDAVVQRRRVLRKRAA